MASLDVIRNLTIKAQTVGVDQATSDLKKFAAAEDQVTDATVRQERATTSVDKAFQSLQRRYDQELRAQQDLARVQRTLDMARDQGLVSQQRAGDLMQAAIKYHNQNTQAATGHAQALAALSGEAQGLAGRLGTVGSVLSALGPVGLAAAATVGAITLGLSKAAEAALELADRAGKLRDFSETTGFTTLQLQALQKAGADVGLSAEQVTGSLEKFAVQFDQLKTGSGDLYKTLLQINPALAQQAARAQDVTQAWDLLAKAITQADTSQRAVLARQAFGRGGIGTSRLLGATIDAGGLSALASQMKQVDQLTDEQIKHWDDLGDAIRRNTAQAQQNVVSTFAGPVLEGMAKFSDELLNISRTVKETDFSSGFAKFFATLNLGLAQTIPVLNIVVSGLQTLAALGKSAAAVPSAGPSRFDMVFGDVSQIQGAADKMKAVQQALQAQRDETIRASNASKQYIQALQGTATPAETLKDKILQLNAEVAKGEITSDQAAAATGRLNSEFSLNQAKTAVSALGSAATVAEQYSLKVQELQQQLSRGEISQQTFNRAVQGLRLDQQIQLMNANVAALGDAATASEKYNAKVAELTQQLTQGKISQDAFNRAVANLNPIISTVQDTVSQLGNGLAQAFINGQNAAEAFGNALKSVASSQATTAIKGVVTGLTTGTFDLPSIATSGIVALGASLLSSFFGSSQKDQQNEAQAKADADRAAALIKQVRDAWAAMADEMAQFVKTAAGGVTGSLRQELDDLREKASKLVAAAAAAGDAAGDAAVQFARAQGELRLTNEFMANFDDTIKALGSQDIASALGDVDQLDQQFKELNDSILAAVEVTGDYNIAVKQQAQLAGAIVSSALALLGTGQDTLSETGKQLADLQTKAAALPKVLEDLGFSAQDAATIINNQLNVALDKLRSDFLGGLVRQVNELQGADFVNQAQDLAAQVAQMRTDAASLGVQTSLIDTFYVLSAQKIVDQNQLTGDSFKTLEQLLGLAGSALHEFDDSVSNTATVVKRSSDEIARSIESNEDRLFNALHRSDSLQDQLARFDLDAQRQREEEVRAGGEALDSLVKAQEQERLNIVQDYYDQQLQAQLDAQQKAADEAEKARQDQLQAEQQAAEERQRILDEATQFLQGALRKISDWISNFLSGQQSPLSPFQRLQTAQSAFATNYSQALAGNRDALEGITANAQDLVDAVRAYYGSSTAGQTLINQMISQLQALPSLTSPEQFIVDSLTPPIQDITAATTDQTSTLQAMLNNLITAVNAGDAQSIANALLPVFNSIDTNTSQSIDFSEMVSALGSSFSSGTLASIFQTLDLNGDGQLTQLELIKTATQGTSTNTAPIPTSLPSVASNTDTTSSNTATTNSNLNTANSNLSQANTLQTTANSTLSAIQTAVGFLSSINDFASNTNAYASNLPGMSTALGTIAGNTSAIAGWQPGSSHELGGLLTGPRHAAGGVPIIAEGGEYIMSRSTVQRVGVGTMNAVNFGGAMPAANDNMFTLMRGLERSLMRGIQALIETQLQAAGMMAKPLQEANKLQRTRRGENKKIA